MAKDRKEYMREYREKNREKIKEQKKEYMREYREKNREKEREQKKGYYQANKEKIKEKCKAYYESPTGNKVSTIRSWKRLGLICDDYDDLYDRYVASTNCEECNIEYGNFRDGTLKWKCMDHDHTTGLFRNFLCCSCNIKRR